MPAMNEEWNNRTAVTPQGTIDKFKPNQTEYFNDSDDQIHLLKELEFKRQENEAAMNEVLEDRKEENPQKKKKNGLKI